MKGQDPLVSSSSSRRESSQPEKIRSRSIGCMSGIFQFAYKYHNRRRFLTFVKKHGKDVVSSPEPTAPSSQPSSSSSSSFSPSSSSTSLEQGTKVLQRFSSEMATRSPTLPAEITRSRSLNSPDQSFRSQPALVARLMGLSDIPPMTTAEMALAEKRRRLLGALEKCDEDLKALKKIIDAIKSSSVASAGDDDDEGISEKGNDLPLLQQPSPVSVLDEFTRSALSGFSKRYTINERGVPHQQEKKQEGEDDITSVSFFDRIMTVDQDMIHGSVVTSPLWSSKAMVESVNQVCKDAAWGERREVGRIGLALQDYIFRDLIEEIVKDMGFDCIYQLGPLPFESCKKRLSF
ncbi:hypothetical protein SADUNF_Sadunf06G0018200 [Salix dunnii]|uniref:DUF3741 domain-containing protein n=1 Tax=Salix dunnii TaxID=1413687 RepID=A0A835K6T2_9ROSI|nr:hypothetical protein SADUNF_Sadunf06G0018200 [Salix dunnii]